MREKSKIPLKTQFKTPFSALYFKSVKSGKLETLINTNKFTSSCMTLN